MLERKQDPSRRNQHIQSFIFIPPLYKVFFPVTVSQGSVAQSIAILTRNPEVMGSILHFANTFYFNYLFRYFFRLNRKLLYGSAKYYQIRAQLVRISRKRHLTCQCRTNLISAVILGEKRAQTYARFLIKPDVTGRFC